MLTNKNEVLSDLVCCLFDFGFFFLEGDQDI